MDIDFASSCSLRLVSLFLSSTSLISGVSFGSKTVIEYNLPAFGLTHTTATYVSGSLVLIGTSLSFVVPAIVLSPISLLLAAVPLITAPA